MYNALRIPKWNVLWQFKISISSLRNSQYKCLVDASLTTNETSTGIDFYLCQPINQDCPHFLIDLNLPCHIILRYAAHGMDIWCYKLLLKKKIKNYLNIPKKIAIIDRETHFNLPVKVINIFNIFNIFQLIFRVSIIHDRKSIVAVVACILKLCLSTLLNFFLSYLHHKYT